MKIEPLFDKSLILDKSTNIVISIVKPKFEKIVLNKTEYHEGIGDNYYSIIKHKDKIKMFYRSLNISTFNINSEHSQFLEHTSYAHSDDGLNFVKPQITNNTNILFKNGTSHNFCVTKDDKNDLYGIGGTGFTSTNLLIQKYINNEWITINQITPNDILSDWNHNNHFDSHNIIFYDNNCNHFKIYVRHNKKGDKLDRRFVQYFTSIDLTSFSNTKNITIDCDDEIYTTNFMYYPNSKYYIGFPSSHKQDSNYKKIGMLCYSNDGFDWKILDKNLCDDIETSYMIQNGLIDNNDKFYIYVRKNVWDTINNDLACYSFELNRIQEIKCKGNGYILFGYFNIDSSNIFINYKTNSEDGFIFVEMYDNNNKLINSTEKMVGNFLKKNIKWYLNLTFDKNINIKLKIYLYNSSIYSLFF